MMEPARVDLKKEAKAMSYELGETLTNILKKNDFHFRVKSEAFHFLTAMIQRIMS